MKSSQWSEMASMMAPHLKAAHIGIAMGQRGTEMAKSAAALILMNDDLC